MIRNNDGAADGISIIRLTGVVSLCARWWDVVEGGRRRDFDLARR
jgi:hypothetical protein